MTRLPETRQSLIARVRDAGDSAAWSEFVSIYRPAVFRFALRRGLQPADAEDVTQRVFVAVARAMNEWQADHRAGSFRAWLLLVTKNAVINTLSRKPRAQAAGGTSMLQQLRQVAEVHSADDLEWEYARAEFRRAAEDIRPEFESTTWSAFWMTAVEQQDIAATSARLKRSIGSVYAARSRVMRRLKQRVAELQQPREGD